MGEDNQRRVEEYLSQGLGCAVAAEARQGGAETHFVPASEDFGRLQLGEDLASADETKLLERLRRDGVDELLRRGERVRVTRAATEILPRG